MGRPKKNSPEEEPPAETPEGAESEAPDLGPIEAIQGLLGELDPKSMVVGFSCVVEWLEPDGARALSVLHTPMSPWQMYGLMTFGREHRCVEAEMGEVYILDEDEDEE